MFKTRDFMTLLLIRFRATKASELKGDLLPATKALPEIRTYADRQVQVYKPKPTAYRPASNM